MAHTEILIGKLRSVMKKHWANNEGIAIKELTVSWRTQTVNRHRNVAYVLMGPTLGAVDTKFSCGERVRSSFLEEIKTKSNSDKTSKVMPG